MVLCWLWASPSNAGLTVGISTTVLPRHRHGLLISLAPVTSKPDRDRRGCGRVSAPVPVVTARRCVVYCYPHCDELAISTTSTPAAATESHAIWKLLPITQTGAGAVMKNIDLVVGWASKSGWNNNIRLSATRLLGGDRATLARRLPAGLANPGLATLQPPVTAP